METKHTKEYAELEAKRVYLGTKPSNLEIEAFIYGYLHAIDRAAAPELLEALNKLVNKFDSVKQVKELGIEKELNEAINSINKATK